MLVNINPNAPVANATYSEDVYNCTIFTGSTTDLTVNTGIDYSRGAMIMYKRRNLGGGTTVIQDTVRGAATYDYANGADANFGETTDPAFPTLFNNGSITFVGGLANSAAEYAMYSFVRAPGFFDIVAYTGNGATGGQEIKHKLGSTPGMVWVHCRTDVTGGEDDYVVWHRGMTAGTYAWLSYNDGEQTTNAANYFGNNSTTVDPTSTAFTVGNLLNDAGSNYIVYLFGHDTSSTGIIRCEAYTHNTTTGNTVTSFESQFMLEKRVNTASNWLIYDKSRGWGTVDQRYISTNAIFDDADDSWGWVLNNNSITFVNPGWWANNDRIITCNIKLPRKVPTAGSQVYSAVTSTGTGANATISGFNFNPDLIISKSRSVAQLGCLHDRHQGRRRPPRPPRLNLRSGNFPGP